MAGRGAPSFLKRQKEQKRVARALAKREAKQSRRDNRAAGLKPDGGFEEEISAEQDPNLDGTTDDTSAETQDDSPTA